MKHLKQQFLTLLFLAASFTAFAQVGVGTTTPEGALDVVSANSGHVVPRVANTAAVVNPQGGAISNGTMVYDESSNCIKVYENSAWSDCLSGGSSASIANNCDQNGFEGSYMGAVALGAANDFTVTISNNSSSTSTIAFTTSDLVLSGAGLGTVSVASVSPTSVSLTAGQSQLVRYQLSGTPVVGTLQADWTKLSLSCTKTVGVTNNGDATFTLPQRANVVSVYDAGPPVVDIQGVVDNASNQVVVNVPYTSGTGSYDAYTSAAVAVTGEGGDTNNLTISYPAGTFSATGTIPVTVTVDGDGSFNVTKQALEVVTTFATLDFQVNGTSKGNVLLDAVGGIPDRAFGDGVHDFIYFPVVAEDGNTWLNNNLGAHYADTNHASFAPTQQATASNDHLAYGSLYQWGRYSDEHERINWTSATAGTPVNGTTTTLSVSDTPGDSNFITSLDDWRSPQNDNLWQGEAGINNPCPVGYRVPTDAEWDQLLLDAGISNRNTAASSNLALPSAGYRDRSNGLVYSESIHGYYWSSTVSGTDARLMALSSTTADALNYSRAYGFSVRCLKN